VRLFNQRNHHYEYIALGVVFVGAEEIKVNSMSASEIS
jgi:hypothetical protein